jgi:hypothetical protein
MSVARCFTALINNTVVRTINRLAVEAAKCWQDVNSTREGDQLILVLNKLQHTLSPSEVGAVTVWAWLGSIESRLCCAASPLRDDSIQAPLRAIENVTFLIGRLSGH